MISNLLTSLLIATAVGGTTATAFDNEPKKANESQEQVQIRKTENILDETNDWNSINDYGEAAPYYKTTEEIDGMTLYNNYWTKQYEYYLENKWEVENRTYLKMTSVRKDNYSLDYYNGEYYVYEAISITKIQTYVDLVHIDSTEPMQIQRKVIQDQDEVVKVGGNGTQYVEKRTQNLQNNTIDNYIIGQTPPNQAYQTNSIGYIYNDIKTVTQLVNSNTFNYNDADEDYLGSDHLDFSYNYDEIMQTNYIITYVYWHSAEVGWTPNNQRPDIDIESSLIRIRNKVDITYTEMVYIDSNGGTTPVVTQEIIDIPALMYTVMTMPFAFISQAFNLTLWAGTPYQVNFSNIFLVILSILIILFVVKIITRFMK